MNEVTTADLRAALRAAHANDEYVVLFEVPDRTGRMPAARADALVMSLWPSRGCEITGFELKASRADWLAELKAPAKADHVMRYCERWCVLAAPQVVREAELPSGWGLWELAADGTLRRRVQSALRECEPPSRGFLAALLRARNRLDGDDLQSLYARHRRQWERARSADGAAASPPPADDADRVARALAKLEAIRASTGIDLADHVPAPQWIERLRLVSSPRFEHRLQLLRTLFSDTELKAQVARAFDPSERAP